MSNLQLTRFGNPILRQVAHQLSVSDIRTATTKQLIQDMRNLLVNEGYGVGLAAPQVGVPMALSVIDAHSAELHPEAVAYQQVIINPSYQGVGRRTGMWEGCMSCGSGDDVLYAKALRYKTIQAHWLDEEGVEHKETLNGLPAHIFQHETDHLHGILFIDRVRDRATCMMADEYRKRVLAVAKANA